LAGRAYLTGHNIGLKVAQWKRALSRYERHPFRIAPDGTALIVIDMQRYFTSPGSHAYLPASKAIMPRVLGIVSKFLHKGLPVIFTRHAHRPGEEGVLGLWWKDTIREGTPESELDARIGTGGSTVLRKTRYSAFAKTELEADLRRLGTGTVAIAGVMTHLCCETTARDAFMRDLQPVLLMDATATDDEALHLSSLRTLADGFAEVMTCRELERRLGWRR
jgi:isochorismate hydrolase